MEASTVLSTAGLARWQAWWIRLVGRLGPCSVKHLQRKVDFIGHRSWDPTRKGRELGTSA